MIEETANHKTYILTANSENARALALQLTKCNVPQAHKKIANNYCIVKKIFKFQACQSRISNVEKATMSSYDFNTLEYTTMQQMRDEIKLLQQMALSEKAEQRLLAETILNIRVKELKFIEASCYATITNEIYNGYKVLEQYLKEICRFRNSQYMSSSIF